ncbi:hypothetical protein D3C78_866740 [compost metagenome]
MAVEERATARIFTGQTNRNAFIDQRGIGQIFCAAPVEQLLTCRHGLTVGVDFLHAGLHLNGFRHGADTLRQLLQTLGFNLVRVALIPFVVEVRRPGEGVHIHRTQLFHHTFARIQRITVKIHQLGGIFQRRGFFRFQFVSVNLTRRRMLFDFLIHQRLGCTRLVRFVMAMTAIAEQVDEHIAFERIAEVQRQTGYESDRFRIIRINVEDGCLHHFTDIGTVRARTRIQWVRGRKAHLVVDNDANRTAHFVTTRFRHVQGFLNHALASYRSITVNGDWQHFIAAWLVESVQTRAHGADNHRAYDLQVRRVKRQRQVNQTAVGFDIRREAHVVLHIARTEMFFVFARKFVEQILWFFTQHVDQHVQTTAVRHTQHHFTRSAVARMADQLFQHRH